MALIFNATKKLQDSVVLTSPSHAGKYPQSTRDALYIHKANKSGIFQIEKNGARKLYDRCYAFTDINYINQDKDEKIHVLENLMDFFKSMSMSFKITIVDEYQDMNKFIDDIFVNKNDDEYPVISSGIRQWIDEKKEEARIYDIKRILLLTLTVRSSSYDEARSYFLGMDTEIERAFAAFKSKIVPLNGEQRLEIIDRFFYKEDAGAPYSFESDALYDVIPVSIDNYKDFMIFNKNQYVSVLFARRFDTSVDANKAIYTLSNREYPSFITIDYAPVAHDITKDALKSMFGNTGSGKSMFIKMTEISQVLLSSDDDIQIIDPQNETQFICALYGGKFLDMTPRGDIHVNPMEIPLSVFESKSDKVRQTFISSVTGWANSFTEAVMKNMAYTAEHKAFVTDAVANVYDRTFSAKKLVQPTIKDVRNELIRMEEESEYDVDKRIIHMMTNSLKPFTEGIYDMFAYPSDIDISRERLVSFGLNNIQDDVWQPVMTTIMFFLTNRIEFNQELQRATRFIVDECQYVTKSISTGDILLKAVLTYRKFGGICTMAFQNLARVVMSEDLRDMLANCGYKMFFKQEGADAIALSKIQNLTDIEYEALSNDSKGRSVMVWNGKVILLDAFMKNTNPLYESFSTNFHEKAAAMKLKNPEQKE